MCKNIKSKPSNEDVQNFNSEKYKMACPEYKMLINIDEDPKLDIDTNKNTEINEVHKGYSLMKNSQQLSKQCYVVQTRRSNNLFIIDDDDTAYFKEIKK